MRDPVFVAATGFVAEAVSFDSRALGTFAGADGGVGILIPMASNPAAVIVTARPWLVACNAPFATRPANTPLYASKTGGSHWLVIVCSGCSRFEVVR